MTTAEQMPPLPPLEISWGYGEEEMHAYARAYAAQEVARERAWFEQQLRDWDDCGDVLSVLAHRDCARNA